MKIKDIIPDFELEKDLTTEDAIRIYNQIIKSGEVKAKIYDYLACPDCGNSNLDLFERAKGLVKGTILHCNVCKWELIEDEWEYLLPETRSKLIERFNKFRRDK